MLKKSLMILTAISLVISPLMAKSKKDRAHRPHKEHGMMFEPERMQKQLSLSAQQVTQIKTINATYKQKAEALENELKPTHEEISQAVMAENVDIENIRNLMKAASDKMIDLRVLRIEHRLEIEKVLTPEQKTKWKEQHKKMMKKMNKKDHKKMMHKMD